MTIFILDRIYSYVQNGHGHLPGWGLLRVVETSKPLKPLKPLKLSRQNSRHFEAVDSELGSWETSKHVS